jgi:xanthine/CO dehydrogenase XdhC/CoxF family maturation factor
MAQLAVYDTTSENDLIWGVGLGCHGVVQVLIERLPARPAWASEIVANLKEGRTSELAVVWRADNAGELGTRLVQGVAEARSKGMGLDDGIFVERVRPPPRLVIFGAGDDAQPLARLAKDVGWAITVADARPAFATPGRFPEADSIACGEPSTLVRLADPGPEALAVVMTHRYVHDIPILRELLSRPLAYLGLLGPRKRAYKMLDDLAAGGLSLTDDMRARLHAPVGLDIGGDSPDEVALSIVAEIQAVLTGRDGRPLRERPKPIHA